MGPCTDHEYLSNATRFAFFFDTPTPQAGAGQLWYQLLNR